MSKKEEKPVLKINSRVRLMYKRKVEKALESLEKEHEEFKAQPMVDFTLKIATWLFDKGEVNEIDKVAEASLIRTGVRLTGAYGYFGNKAAYARAERDVYEQKADEVLATLLLEYIDESYKVTEARSRAKQEMSEAGLTEAVIAKELVKNDWENLMSATDKMISFIQTTLSYRKNEQYRSNQMHSG